MRPKKTKNRAKKRGLTCHGYSSDDAENHVLARCTAVKSTVPLREGHLEASNSSQNPKIFVNLYSGKRIQFEKKLRQILIFGKYSILRLLLSERAQSDNLSTARSPRSPHYRATSCTIIVQRDLIIPTHHQRCCAIIVTGHSQESEHATYSRKLRLRKSIFELFAQMKVRALT